LPHLDLGLAERTAAEQRRLGVQFLEVAADGDGFGEDCAIVKFEHRQALQRIARGNIRLLVLHRPHVDGNPGHIDALFGQKHADAPRVRRPSPVKQLHFCLLRLVPISEL
jgi:hypothetical protein